MSTKCSGHAISASATFARGSDGLMQNSIVDGALCWMPEDIGKIPRDNHARIAWWSRF